MSKFRKILISGIILSTSFVHQAPARESFYDLSTREPSVVVNLSALNQLEPPAYMAPIQQVKQSRGSRSYTKSTQTQPTQIASKNKKLPVVSEDFEPAPKAATTKIKTTQTAQQLPVVNSDLQLNQAPPPPLKSIITNPPPPSAFMKPADQQPAPKLTPAPPPPPVAENLPPVKQVELPPAPPLPSIQSKQSLAPTPPVPIAQAKLLSAPPPLANGDQVAPTRVVISSKTPPPKSNDNIVALPPVPAPPPPPVQNSTGQKTLAATNTDLSLPPPMPSPPPALTTNDLDNKIASEKASITSEQIKTKSDLKNAAAKMPTPKDLASSTATNSDMPDLPPMPTPPSALDNSLPPLPSAPPVTPTKTIAANTDLPPLPPIDSYASKTTSSTTSAPPPPPELKASSDSLPSKESVMVQPDKISAPSGNSGVITMPYSEAETEVPLVEKSKLDSVIAQLEADKTKNVTIIAYASGTPEQASQAKRTSLARVLAVRKYLMERNVDADRINPRPLGNHAESGVPDRVDIIVEKSARG